MPVRVSERAMGSELAGGGGSAGASGAGAGNQLCSRRNAREGLALPRRRPQRRLASLRRFLFRIQIRL